MKIKAASAAQKDQPSQAINQSGQSGANSGADLSLRQEFQAALENFAGHGISASHGAQVALTTFDIVATGSHSFEQRRPKEQSLKLNNERPQVASDDVTSNVNVGRSENSKSSDKERDAATKQDEGEDSASAPTSGNLVAVETSAGTVVNQTKAAQTVEKECTPTELTAEGTPGSESETILNQTAAANEKSSAETGKQLKQNEQKVDPSKGDSEQLAAAPKLESEVATPKSANAQNTTNNGPISGNNSEDTFAKVAESHRDVAAAALQTAIAATLSQRLAAGGSSATSESHNPHGINAIGQSGKAEGSSNSGFGAIRNDVAFKSELSRNAEQSVKATRIQPSKILERVESTLKEAARSRDGKTISLRLDPPELGTLKVDVSIRDGALHARISAENSQVAGVIREKAYELQSMLRKLGLSVEKVSVSVHDGMQYPGGEFSQNKGNTGNSSSSNQEKSREFNDFGAGSNFALTQQTPVSAVLSKEEGKLAQNTSWVA